uniref:Acyl-CoA thioesterase 8 n=1 Tax=Ursus americanus TaxID=9643 RepID=A0A452R3F1_URSAM
MSSRQAPEDEQGGGDPPGDLRSVLVTSVLSLEPLDEDLFRGRHYWVPTTQRLFGGQIVGQALVAAAKSVSEDIHVHSLHCYFVRAAPRWAHCSAGSLCFSSSLCPFPLLMLALSNEEIKS